MVNYDVLTQPWIPVETLEGQLRQVGIFDALAKAHEYRCVRASSPLVTYGIQRMLIAFVSDAFRPSRVAKLAELIAQKSFDKTILEQYINLCRQNGECFDLFDKERPFMQCAKKETEGEETRFMLTRLFAELPAGNNHTHFQHVLENGYLFTPAECAQILCTVPVFALNFGTNSCFSINGMPPLYFLYAGNNLFETLSASMVTQADYPELSWDNPPVAWRNTNPVLEGGIIPGISILYGLTCQPRKITLLPTETANGIFVKEMYYAKGWNFKELPNWKDPHVAYYYDKDKNVRVLKAQEGRGVWRDLGKIINCDFPPKIINKSKEKLNINSEQVAFINFNACGLIGEFKGPVYASTSWLEESLSFDTGLLDNSEKIVLLNQVLDKCEALHAILCKTIKSSVRQLTEKSASKDTGQYESLVGQAQSIYFSQAKACVLGDFCNSLAQITDTQTVGWDLAIKIQMGEKLKKAVKNAFETICNSLGSSAKTLQWIATSERVLYARINKLMKGEWLNE